MQMIRRALTLLRFVKAPPAENHSPNYQQLMRATLQRMRLAEIQLQEATSLEELDIARSAMQSCMAEVQQLIRSAKRDRGITVRPIAETEEMHRTMRDVMHNRAEGERPTPRRRTGTSR